ncbi:MAG: hypothetical protein JKY08_07725 [Flavobacteriaceae bacterium]|nr:hypothetical protein [Flavobacteriaceae bacterium]
MQKRKTSQEKLQSLGQKKARIQAQINAEESKVRKKARKDDTRRKIIAGALALEHAEIDAEFGTAFRRILIRFVSEKDRKLFDF